MESKLKFTEQKFCSLSQEKQHKHLACLLKATYLKFDLQEERNAFVDTYNTWTAWIKLPALKKVSRTEIADRYHEHLKKAHIQTREHNLLPNVSTEDRKQATPPLNWTVYLDNLRSAFNVGSIIRTTEAFSLGRVVFGKSCPGLECKQVKDASMQTHDWIETKHIDNIEKLPRPIIALETVKNASPQHEYPFPKEGTLVLGNEEYGCSDDVLKAADAIISIPLYGKKNSLNVANAFSIVAETIRRRSQNDT